MTTIRLLASDQQLRPVEQPKLASGNKKSVMLQVSFSKEWKDYTKSAVFFREHSQTVYEVLLTEGRCVIPHEVLEKPGSIFVGVRGVTADAEKTTGLIRYWVAKGAPIGNGTAVEPTPEIYQQILARLEKMEELKRGADGKDGVSCTHSWNGTVLTVVSASGSSSADLKGDSGPQGPQGEQGPRGESGHSGTPRNWLDNSYFLIPVNQKGLTSASYDTCIDRWEAASADYTMEVKEDGIVVTGDCVSAVSDCRELFGKKVTVALNGYYIQDGTSKVEFTLVASGTMPEVYNGKYICPATHDCGISIGLIPSAIRSELLFSINGSNFTAPATLRWAALYLGEYTADTLPDYQYKGYAVEQLECLRHYGIGPGVVPPLVLSAEESESYLTDSACGDEALDAILKGRQLLVRTPNADGGNFTAIYSPIMMYQLPNYANNYLYLFYLRDEKQTLDLSAVGMGAIQLPVYGQLKMLLSETYNESPLK